MRDPRMLATGKVLLLLVSLLQRNGVFEREDFGDHLAALGAICAEKHPEQADILGAWALMFKDLSGLR